MSGKWKNKLLSSGLPLEFEAAKILAAKGFTVTPDYTYARNDLGILKDFSVDAHGSAYIPFTDPNRITCSLDILVECKHRHRNVKWLCLPDVNKDDCSPFIAGHTIRSVDEFSDSFLPDNVGVDFDLQSPSCFKCIEIDVNGRVYDSELRHGIAQLQYALPRLLTDQVLCNIYAHREDNRPFLFCPILLTSADIHLAHDGFDVSTVENSAEIEDFSDVKPYVVAYYDVGPDFKAHCREACDSLASLPDDVLDYIVQSRIAGGEYEFRLPNHLAAAIANADRFELSAYFTQFILCTVGNFGQLVDDLKRIASNAARGTRRHVVQ